MDFKIGFLFSLFILLTHANYISYKDYKVYKILPKNNEEVQILVDLQKDGELIYWTDNIYLRNDVKIMVGPEKKMEFEAYLKKVGIKYDIVIHDVKSLIDAQMNPPSRANGNNSEYNWDYYQSIEEIYDWLQKIADEYPDVVSLVTIGTTLENRQIRGVVIDYKRNENITIGMIEGGIHAREWISPATVTWIINEFLTSTDTNIRNLAENVVWHIFPVTNPDGYSYTFTTNRMWRKNRNTSYNATCGASPDLKNGVDLNRNFGYLWMTTGASANPCAETFAGSEEFSELESIAISNYVNEINRQGRLVYYFAFHSYSQMVLVPYSHVSGADVLEAENYADMYEIAIRGMDKLRERHGTNYVVGTSAEILYAVSGSSFDWVKGVVDVPIVYLFELRDIGEYGFLLPTELIVDNNQEIMDGLLKMDRVTRELGYYEHHYNYSGANTLKISAMLMLLVIVLIK